MQLATVDMPTKLGVEVAKEREYGESLIHELVLARCREAPNRVAVVCGGRSLTYGQLDDWSASIAADLADEGAFAGEVVGVAINRDLGMIAGILGVLRAGCAYAPIDPLYPADRISHVIKSTGARLLLASDGAQYSFDSCRIVRVERDFDSTIRRPHRSRSGMSEGDAAYVMFTSGSTGVPKGVVCVHGAVVSYLITLIDAIGLATGDRVLAVTSSVHDPSVRDIFGTLLSGATLILATGNEIADPEALVGLMERERPTACLSIIPRLLDALLEVVELRPRIDWSIERVLTCGERLYARTADRARKLFAAEVWNQYGPTEVTMVATFHRIGLGDAAGGWVPIGRPVPGVVVRVVDRWGEVVPVGVVGELVVGGSGVARGYVGQPGLTAERFVPDRWGSGGGRLYRTGDLGRLRADGVLEFVGRVDDQVKVRGYRVEPGEVVAVVRRHPLVVDAAVVPWGDGAARHLVAYVVGSVEVASLREFVRGVLPEFMVPSKVVVLESLPLSSNGKVDRRALPDPGMERPLSGAVVVPRTATESVVAGVWAEVLGIEEVGVDDDFFDLGGHSLLVMAVVARLRERLGVDVRVQDVFSYPTIAGLAALADEARAVVDAPLAVADRDGPLPASFAQQRLWFLDQMVPKSAAYNMVDAYRIRGGLDVAALERALAALVDRHESLRTTFASRDGVPVQVVGAAGGVRLTVEEVVGGGAGEVMERARLRVDEEAARPFDLGSGPLLRAVLLRLGADDCVLVLIMHHVVSDGWSMGVVATELGALYDAAVSGEDAGLPTLAVQYADVAVWQRQQMQGRLLEEQLTFWRGALADLPALELPTDRPRPAVQSFSGARVELVLDPDTAAGLRRMCRAEGVTLFMALLAAFQMLLARYTSTTDVPVGFAAANRSHSGMERLVGFFVNTLIVRTRLDGDPSFTDALARVREVTLAALHHQDLPFERLVEEMAPARDLSRNPLFQVLFQVMNAPNELAAPTFTGLEVEDLRPQPAFSVFDLAVEVEDRGNEIAVGFTYATDLFDRSTVERMAGHLATLVSAVVDNPALQLSTVPLLTDDELDLLAAWNDTARAPQPGTVIDLFDTHVRNTPDAVAVIDIENDNALTYRQLDERSRRIAAHLRDLGAQPEHVIAICLPRTAELITAVIAVLRTGAAYLPLEPSHPTGRIHHMLEATAARAAIVDHTTARHFTSHCLPTTDLADIDHATTSPLPTFPPPHPDTLAYVIYTSGSTGRPKGIAIPHRELLQSVAARLDLYGEDPIRLLWLSAVGFDTTVAALFWPLCTGGSIAVPSANSVRDPVAIRSAIASVGVTTLLMLPSLYEQVLGETEHQLGSLCTAVVAGEACSAQLVSHHYAAAPWARLVNEYGPAEATVWATAHVIGLGDAAGGWVPIGRPVPGVVVRVVDRWGEVVPVGVVGELVVGGSGVARGYVGQPGLTAERFVPDRWGSGGGRLYRTGDLGRLRADGVLEFVGRVDDQVKVRGYRVEPGEVVAVVRRHPLVVDAAVVPWGDGAARHLVAYVVGSVEVASLREFVRGVLPEFMVPSKVVVLESLPLSSNGKVDRRALPDPGMERPLSGAVVVPRTATESVVAGVWAEVLGIEEVGVDDDFFDLGGHSLLVMAVVARLRERLGVDVRVQDVFSYPTIAGLAALADEARAVVDAPLAVADRDGPLPASFAQQRLWFLDQMVPKSAAYNMVDAYRIRGGLDVAALERALAALVDRHESLRTTFASRDGVPVQVVGAAGGVRLTVEEVVGGGAGEVMERARLRVDEEAARPFDLGSGPLLRAVLLRLGADDCVLVLIMHHVVSDGWSMGVVATELGALYDAAVSGEDAGLPTLAVQYADVAVWQRQQMQGRLLEEQLTFWRGALADLPALELPTDRPRPAVQSFSGARVELVLDPDTAAGLRRMCRAEGVTLFMALLAAFQMLLARYTSTTDVPVGFAAANRSHSGMERLVGFFVNTLIVRTRLDGDPSFTDALARVREVTLAALHHQDLPFERLVEEMAPARDLSRNPLFQVLFQVMNAPNELAAPTFTGLEVEDLRPQPAFSVFDLAVEVEDRGNEIAVGFTYATDLFDRSTVERMAGHLATLVSAVVDNPALQLSTVPLLTDDELDLLAAWNDTARAPQPGTVIDLFDTHVRNTPDAVAVIDIENDNALTYRQLDERSRRIAAHLRDLGAQPEHVIAICLPRTAELITAVIAVLRTGAAYLPLEPSHPTGRIHHMLEATAARAAIVDHTTARHFTSHCLPTTDLADIDHATTSPLPTFPPPHPDTLAYVIYTSGSTGRPKGIAMPHGPVADLVASHMAQRGSRRILQFSSIGFDVSFLEIFGALTSGATVVTVSDPVRHDPQALLKHIALANVDTTFLPPTTLRAVAAADAESEYSSPLRDVMSGGEAMHVNESVRRFFDRAGASLENFYGPSEAHGVTALALRGATRDWPDFPSVGTPLINCTIRVLDRWGNQTPIGVSGEIFVGGTHVSRGYIGGGALTAALFQPDPYGFHGARRYKSGDLGRWRQNGSLEVLGRIDDQVKVRGYRVEPGEVAAVLREHPGVTDAVVMPYTPDNSGETHLVGYVTARKTSGVTARDLRAHLRTRLPDQMVPSRILVLESTPLNQNGKIDHSCLPRPESIETIPDSASSSPNVGTESVVAAAWCEVLGLDHVSAEDNFFDSGGTSMSLLVLRSRLTEVLGQRITVVDLFAYATVRSFSDYIDRKPTGDTGTKPDDRGAKRAAARQRRSRGERDREH
ncbi:non-ribosomal peptide synthetase [Microlunatus speluncae]|uniref:non-ribosomal peptide synthetase n=1 Tax=Microlunatus speluncae TaxID=2594267 RepID=UPI0012661E9F|nr:non-ribosomal peptide synthetase [Microlunatus speluncae]